MVSPASTSICVVTSAPYPPYTGLWIDGERRDRSVRLPVIADRKDGLAISAANPIGGGMITNFSTQERWRLAGSGVEHRGTHAHYAQVQFISTMRSSAYGGPPRTAPLPCGTVESERLLPTKG